MSTVISVERVSKSYRLGQIGGGTLKADFGRWWAKMRGKPDPLLKIGEEHKARLIGEQFWALQDVSFQVKEGEVLGIIGRNGAGKSTLLKILSQVTTPTSGQIKVKGRIASLLEVGTGFHPELTGRENVFLNGAILGMTKAEIRKKFDEIVDFSGVEEFIDTPVKRYSSGMYVRLAFAVAAHLEPEILIVDEVLAVGDAEFQRKCLGKMQDVSKNEGRTVLFVSHSMPSILSLCAKCALLDSGIITKEGPTRPVVEDYLASFTEADSLDLSQRHDRRGDGSARIISVSVANVVRDCPIDSSTRLKITIHYESTWEIRRPTFAIGVYDSNDVCPFLLSSEFAPGLGESMPASGSVECVTEPINLAPGKYYLNVELTLRGDLADYVQRAAGFYVEPSDFYKTGKMPPNGVLCLLTHKWISCNAIDTNPTR